ncbi:MAG: 50S ribosomal protein L32 [Christensenellales bacterium]|jgi:large subunit ribosomal protein L32
MAVPKRRTSRQRSHTMRSANFKLTAPSIAECPQCHAMKLTHRVCPTCGYYNGRHVMNTEKAEKAR